jgi:hypothetical protein
MTILMAVYDADSCAGQCDTECYAATEPEPRSCSCICGGQNHGAGLNQAIRNTLKYWGQWLDRATEANPPIVAADIFPVAAA